MTGRQQLDAMISTELGPWFRARGFKKKRNTFLRVQGDAWERIDFQASAWGSRDNVRFTINLATGLTSLDGNLNVVDSRIGSLLPGGEDLWWDVDEGTDLSALGDVMRTVLEEIGEPWTAERPGLPALIAKAQTDPINFPWHSLQRFHLLLERAGLTDETDTIAAVIAALPPRHPA